MKFMVQNFNKVTSCSLTESLLNVEKILEKVWPLAPCCQHDIGHLKAF